MSEFPDGWTIKKLGEVGRTFSGGTPSTTEPSFWDGEIPWATPTDITRLRTRFIEKTGRKISETGLANCSSPLLPKHSLLICTRATIGDTAINTVPMATNQGFKNLVLHREYDVDFVYYLLILNFSFAKSGD